MENPSPAPSPNAALRTLPADLLRSRELLLDLVRKDLRVRYRYAAAGFLWALAEPLAYMAVLTLVFQWILAPRTGTALFGADIPYAAGLLCGLVFWQFTSSALSSATASLVDNQHLVKKVNFTREVVPLAALGYPVVTLAIGLVLLLLVHLSLGGRLGPGLVWVPALLCLQIVATAGLALLLSCGNARFRDVGHMVSVALVLGFYASPVFYDLDWVLAATDRIPQPLVAAYLANPMAELLEAYRQAILEGRRPDAWLFYWPATFAVLSALAGATAFRRAAPTLSDYL